MVYTDSRKSQILPAQAIIPRLMGDLIQSCVMRYRDSLQKYGPVYLVRNVLDHEGLLALLTSPAIRVAPSTSNGIFQPYCSTAPAMADHRVDYIIIVSQYISVHFNVHVALAKVLK